MSRTTNNSGALPAYMYPSDERVYIRRPADMKRFLPTRSEMRPTTGMVALRARLNMAKIAPSHRPFAPRVSAYSGRMGTMMPTPSMEVKMEMKRTLRILFRVAARSFI